MRAAYRSGRLTNGGLGLGDIPIIDYRAYNDDAAGGDIHLRYHSFSMRGRIKEANGHAKNHVMLVEDSRYGLYSTDSPLLRFAIAKMDEWIGNIEADGSHRSKAEKIARAKPKDLKEGCNTRDPNPTFIAEPQVLRQGQCEQLYPSAPPPREVAGAPNEADVIKCRLQHIDWDDYKVPFSRRRRRSFSRSSRTASATTRSGASGSGRRPVPGSSSETSRHQRKWRSSDDGIQTRFQHGFAALGDRWLRRR